MLACGIISVSVVPQHIKKNHVIPFYWRDWSVKFSYSSKLTQKAVSISDFNSISRFQVWAASIHQELPMESSRKSGGMGQRRREHPDSRCGRIKVRSSFFDYVSLGPPAPWSRPGFIHIHPSGLLSMGSRCYIWIIQAQYTRVSDELKSPQITHPAMLPGPWLCAPGKWGWEEQLPNLPRNFLWVSDGSLSIPLTHHSIGNSLKVEAA